MRPVLRFVERVMLVKNRNASIVFGGLSLLAALQRLWVLFLGNQPEGSLPSIWYYFVNVLLIIVYGGSGVAILRAKTTFVRNAAILLSIFLIVGGAVFLIWMGWVPPG